ncbi:MAG: DUF167 domain-containing protein [Planctomycetes bacterium]|nr:DUF167 domain-containing protein [Planctomycetota bacterium]
MIDLEQRGDDVLLPVQAQPKSRKNAVGGVHNGRLKVAVTPAPEKGKANAALVKVLAEALNLKRSQIELAAGATTTHKVFRITTATTELIRARIDELMSD